MLFGNTSMNPPSRFIGEIDPNLIEKEESKVVENHLIKQNFIMMKVLHISMVIL